VGDGATRGDGKLEGENLPSEARVEVHRPGEKEGHVHAEERHREPRMKLPCRELAVRDPAFLEAADGIRRRDSGSTGRVARRRPGS
jgi:hypothetical protein